MALGEVGSDWRKVQGACPECGGRDLREAPHGGGLWCLTCKRKISTEMFEAAEGLENGAQRRKPPARPFVQTPAPEAAP